MLSGARLEVIFSPNMCMDSPVRGFATEFFFLEEMWANFLPNFVP